MPPRRRPRLDSTASQLPKLQTAVSPSTASMETLTPKAQSASSVTIPDFDMVVSREKIFEEAKRLASEDPWTEEQETLLLEAIIQWKPTGIHKHFRMIAISLYLQNHGVNIALAPHTRIPGIWAKLRTLYDLDILDEREMQHFWTEYADQVAARTKDHDEDEAAEETEEEEILPTRSRTSRASRAAKMASPAPKRKTSPDVEVEADVAPITYFSLPMDEFEEEVWQRRVRRDGSSDRNFLPSSSPDIPDLYSLRPTAEWIAKRKAQNRETTPEVSSRSSSSSPSSLSSPAPPSALRGRRRNTQTSTRGRNTATGTPTAASTKSGRGKAATPAIASEEDGEGESGDDNEGGGETSGHEDEEEEEAEETEKSSTVSRGRRGKRGRGGSGSTTGGTARRKRR